VHALVCVFQYFMLAVIVFCDYLFEPKHTHVFDAYLFSSWLLLSVFEVFRCRRSHDVVSVIPWNHFYMCMWSGSYVYSNTDDEIKKKIWFFFDKLLNVSLSRVYALFSLTFTIIVVSGYSVVTEVLTYIR